MTSTAPPHIAPDTLPGLFAASVREDADAIALRYFDGALSRRTVDQLSDRLACLWQRQGVGPGDRVAIILQNVPQFAVAVLAAWKIGAVAVAMNPMYRTPELRALLSDCAPAAILCHDDHLDVVEAATAELANCALHTTSPHAFQSRNDTRVLPEALAAHGPASLHAAIADITEPLFHRVNARPSDIALLLYTSGTTGTPKAAMLSHANLLSNALYCRDGLGLDDRSRILGVAPLFHITGFVCHLCAAWASGASLILTYRFTPALALDTLREHRPTFMIAAITAYIALMEAEGVRPSDFESLTALYSGGAPVPPAVVDRFAARFGKHIRSCYGMTETAAPAIFSPPEGAIPVDPDSGALSIGKPIPGSEAAIVDDRHASLPDGAIGEVALRGPAVMLGYWNKPEETRSALVDGWMLTGDVGFRDAGGWYYLIDRKKDVIIASGFKVWPREVEDVLYGCPAVREAAVIGVPDDYRGETVVAFVSLKADMAATPGQLIEWCRERLAAYKCPRNVELLDELPKTISGKITRAALRRSHASPRNFE